MIVMGAMVLIELMLKSPSKDGLTEPELSKFDALQQRVRSVILGMKQNGVHVGSTNYCFSRHEPVNSRLANSC